MSIGFDYGRGQGHVMVLAFLLLIAWPVVALAIPAAFVWYVLRPLVKVAWRHRIATGVLAVVVALAVRLGVVETAGLALGTGLVLVVELGLLRLVRPVEFARYVSGPWARRRRRHRLAKTWTDVAVGHGLGHIYTHHTWFWRRAKRIPLVPALRKVTAGPYVDRLVARPLLGQTADGWARCCDALAVAYGAVECRVGMAGRGHLFLDIVRHDPLVSIVPALPISERVDLAAVPVGLGEDGSLWTVRLEANHLLVAGATGSGKGSVLWSTLRALGPGVRDGWVQVWAVDPKGGQELYPGRPLFHRYADESPVAMVELLEAAVAAMEARSKRYRGVLRKHRTTVEDPLVVVLIDELADLTTLEDRKLKERATVAISTLLRKGRAVGYCVVAALQDPAKDVVPFRQLIPTRISLRLAEKAQVTMVLGEGMRDAGARADRIPHPGCEGVAYVVVPHRREPARVRAAWVTDDDIDDLARRYPAPVNRADHYDDDDGGPEGGSPLTSPVADIDEWRDAA